MNDTSDRSTGESLEEKLLKEMDTSASIAVAPNGFRDITNDMGKTFILSRWIKSLLYANPATAKNISVWLSRENSTVLNDDLSITI